MKSLLRFSKILGMGALATLLLVAATSSQVALGAATAAATSTARQAAAIPPGGIIAQVEGQYPGPILMGFTLTGNSTDATHLVPAYHTTDFSAFD